MRTEFARVITELAEERDDICLLSGDIGNRMFDEFKDRFPGRFINCGIAEANMMSVAAGMAMSGLRPFVYTITPFTTTRCLEQIKVGVAYHQAAVTIIGTGSGLSYAELGATHHSLEDLAVLRAIPGVNILAPSDRLELCAQLKEAVTLDSPTYIRIGKKGETNLNKSTEGLGIGKAKMLRDGNDVLVLGIGPILNEAIRAADYLGAKDVSVAVASLGGARPLDEEFLRTMMGRFRHWVTVEEHSVVGGIGSTLLEWVAKQNDAGLKVSNIGTPEEFIHTLGNQRYIRKVLRLDAEGMAAFIENAIAA